MEGSRWNRVIVRAACAVLLTQLTTCSAPAPATAVPHTSQVAGAAVFERICLRCHQKDGEAMVELQPVARATDAVNALRAVRGGEMPPTSFAVASAERQALVGWLCERSGRSASSCAALARGSERTLIRSATTLIGLVPKVARRPVSEELGSILFMQSRPRATHSYRTAGTVAAGVAIATDVCETDDKCFREVLRLATTPPETPAP